jgi:hypothetical protein
MAASAGLLDNIQVPALIQVNAMWVVRIGNTSSVAMPFTRALRTWFWLFTLCSELKLTNLSIENTLENLHEFVLTMLLDWV